MILAGGTCLHFLSLTAGDKIEGILSAIKDLWVANSLKHNPLGGAQRQQAGKNTHSSGARLALEKDVAPA